MKVACPSQVDDWMLGADDHVCGGLTVQAMRWKMSPSDRAAHDEAWGLSFGDPATVRMPFGAGGDEDHPMAVNMVSSLEGYLAASPARVNEVDELGWTMLHREALAGNAPMVKVLLERGANPNAVTRAGKTPHALAMLLGWTRVAEMLKRNT